MRDHRALAAYQHAHELVLAVHEAVHQIPPGDPDGVAAHLEAAALSAAAAVARSCAAPEEIFAEQMEEAGRRLREVGHYVDIVQRRGHIPLDTAVELLEHQTLAGVEVAALTLTPRAAEIDH